LDDLKRIVYLHMIYGSRLAVLDRALYLQFFDIISV